MHHTISRLGTLALAALLISLEPMIVMAEADPAMPPASSSKATATGPATEPVRSNEPTEDATAVVYFLIAAGLWIAILSAAALAIIIMAHRIAVAQRIRPSSDARHRPRNAL